MFTTLVFDLSGVVMSNGLTKASAEIAALLRADQAMVFALFKGPFSYAYREGGMDSAIFWANLAALLKTDKIDAMRQLFFDAYDLMPDTLAMMAKYREQGLCIGYLSNGPLDRAAYHRQKFKLDDFFDFGAYSSELGAIKPNHEIFTRFLERFSLSADQIIFIDDQLPFVEKAQSYGIRSIQFADVAQVKLAIDNYLKLSA